MTQQLQGANLLTLFIARDQRAKIQELQRGLERITTVVDDFYERLGSKNWVFHDLLSISKVETLLADTSDAAGAEERFIELYRDNETLGWWLMRLRAHEGMWARRRQIQRARQHYAVNEFDSCVLHLIAVMDGFVNDFEPAARKGLAARDPEDMTAWDSVVGHHQGLTQVMTTFTKTIKKRIDEEVFEVYRNGIVHGSVTNFDNVVVATKAWNLLFAVADWATATHKASQPQEPEPTWSDVWATLKEHGVRKKYEDAFVPSTITPADPSFSEDAVVARVGEFLEAWQHRRWALVAKFMPPFGQDFKTTGEAARFTKECFERYNLSDWALTEINYNQASAAEVHATATVNDVTEQLLLRMAIWTENGRIGMIGDDGAAWRLCVWAPHSYFITSTGEP
jgi:hypothetical protein